MFPEVGEISYFNDGSCVHPRCITAIEIENGTIKLVRLKEYFLMKSDREEDSKKFVYYFWNRLF